MNIEDEMRGRIGRLAWEAVHDHGAFRRDFPDEEYYEAVAAALSPLLNRVRAEALRGAAVKAQEAFVDEQGGIGYARVRTDWLHAEANRIEQNSEVPNV